MNSGVVSMIKLGLAALLLLPSGTFNFFPLIFLVAFFYYLHYYFSSLLFCCNFAQCVIFHNKIRFLEQFNSFQAPYVVNNSQSNV